MEIRRCNRVTFLKSQFPSKTALWASVAALLQVLDDTENISMVWDDGACVIVDFNPADPALEYARPYWLFDEEYDQVEMMDDVEDDDEADADLM